MTDHQDLRTRLSEQAQRGLPQRAFSQAELMDFLSTATFAWGAPPSLCGGLER